MASLAATLPVDTAAAARCPGAFRGLYREERYICRNKQVQLILRLVSFSFLSALVLFIWGAVTLVFIPWHSLVMLGVKNEPAVLEVLQAQAVETGVYSVPIDHTGYTATSPFAMIMYRPQGMGMGQGAVMAVSFATYWLASLVAALLMLKSGAFSYMRRVLFFVGLGVFTSLVAHVNNWTWMGYSLGYTLVATFDVVVGWFLAGLVLARWLPRGDTRHDTI